LAHRSGFRFGSYSQAVPRPGISLDSALGTFYV